MQEYKHQTLRKGGAREMKKIGRGSLFRALMLIMLVGLPIIILGCGDSGPTVIQDKETIEKTVVVQGAGYDMSAVITKGNRSFIPINKSGIPGDNPDMILGIMDAFEKTHPGLVVTDWKIDKEQDAHYADNKIFGIFVDHQPKIR